MNLAPYRRAIAVIGLLSLGATGLSIAAFAGGRPSERPVVPPVQLVAPAAETEAMVTSSTAAPTPIEDGNAERAEIAADRAETAAERAEVAATRVETIITSTTTTRPEPAAAAPTVVTTEPVQTIDQPTTTTTTAPKAWVEVARFESPWDGSQRLVDVTLETGQLRVWTVAPNGYRVPGVDGQVWVASPDGPLVVLAGRYDDGFDESKNGPWPTGAQRIGTDVSGQSILTGVIVIEEYR